MKHKTIYTLALALITASPLFAKDKKSMKPSPAQLIEAHDTDGDGKLDEAELTTALAALSAKGGKGKKEKKAKKEKKVEETAE